MKSQHLWATVLLGAVAAVWIASPSGGSGLSGIEWFGNGSNTAAARGSGALGSHDCGSHRKKPETPKPVVESKPEPRTPPKNRAERELDPKFQNDS